MSTVEVNGTARTTAMSPAEVTVSAGATTGSLLPSPESALLSSGDVGAELAALAVESGQVERTTAREEREAAEARVDSEDAQEVQAIRAEASSMRVEAWVDAGTTVGAQIVGNSSTAGVIAKAGKALADGYFSAAQKDDEAKAKAFEAAASDARSAAVDAHDTASDASDYIKSALAFYQEYVTTRAQTMTVAAQRA